MKLNSGRVEDLSQNRDQGDLPSFEARLQGNIAYICCGGRVANVPAKGSVICQFGSGTSRLALDASSHELLASRKTAVPGPFMFVSCSP